MAHGSWLCKTKHSRRGFSATGAFFCGQIIHHPSAMSHKHRRRRPRRRGLQSCDGGAFDLDLLQMIGADETFRIELADVLRARRTDGAPAVLCDDFQAADGRAVAGRVREGGFDLVARQIVGRKRFLREACDFRLLFGRGRGIDPFVIVRSELFDKLLVVLRRILSGGRRDFSREEGENNAVLVRRPTVAIKTEEGGSCAFFATESDGLCAQARHEPFEADRNFANFTTEKFADAVDHGTADERLADLRIRRPLRARLEEILDGDGKIVVWIHEAGRRRDDAMAVEIRIVAEGDVEFVFQADKACHGVF